MKYSRGAELQRNNLPLDATIRLRPYRRVNLSQYVLMLSNDSPGWVAVACNQFDALSRIDGLTVKQAAAASESASHLEQTLRQLYKAGLLAIDGNAGLTGRAEYGQQSADEDADCRTDDAALDHLNTKTTASSPSPNTLLIKLTGACNWACTYCYDYDQRRFRENIELSDIAGVIEHIVSRQDRISVLFHGGEPLLRFAELKRIVEYTNGSCRQRGAIPHFSLQTNGSVLTEEIIEFFDDHHFDVGMSIDGPPTINDLTRVDHLGRGTAYVLEDLFVRYRDFMMKRVGFITTVTSHNVHRLREVATYLRELGACSWKTAVFDAEGRGKASPQLDPAVEPYIDFLAWSVGECAAGRWDGFKFKNILELIDTIVSAKRQNMCLKFPCGAGREFIVASADRRLMACDATYDPSFVLGNARRVWMRHKHLPMHGPCSNASSGF